MKIKTLITSAGRRVELLLSFRAAARSLGLDPWVCAADFDPGHSPACQVADDRLAVPRADSLGYAKEVHRLCAEQGVQLVVPTIDTELAPLAAARSDFEAAGIYLAISTTETVAIARDKLRTSIVLSDAGVSTPQTAKLSDVLNGASDIPCPMVLKRIDGSRSMGLHYAENLASIRALDLDVGTYVAQERCVGPEYTVNCYVDQAGVVRAAVPHRRIEVRDGEVSKGVTERRADLTAIAKQIVKAIPGLRGPFCFQAILTKSGPKVFEINARFGGGYPLAHAAGATFSKWLIEEAMGLPCTASDDWQSGLLMLRHDMSVFIKE
jgi:carbamoyl-phosphate synthase large subunit